MTYAPFKKRIYAFLLDYLVILLYGVFGVGTISIVFRSYMEPLFSSSPGVAELTGFLMITLPVSLYFLLSECSTWQGTWGKKKLGIRVTDNFGKPIGTWRATVRTVIKFLPWEIAHFGIWQLILPSQIPENIVLMILYAVLFIMCLYLTVPLMNKRKKNVYDWLAGTEVLVK